ncbi:MAG TPA: hypothetical protein VFK02_22970 [Kofleriaceae bacterium]|nr:hypothetical protein [Kofleriaceae bacterium]
MTDLIRQVDRCQRLLGDHLAAAVQVFGSAALGVIDLPPLTSAGRIAPAQLRAAATLLWCSCVEAAGLPALVDALVDALWNGRIQLPIGAAGARAMEYRRDRDHHRFTADERRAIYDRLFGAPTGFADHWSALVDGLSALGRAPADVGTGGLVARISVTALELAQGLSDRSVGIVGFAGREIVAHVQAALDLLRDPELARTLGGSVWQIVRQHAPALLGHAIDPTPHLDRARAGLAILEWLAAHAPALEAGSLAIGRADPVVRAAETWRAALPEAVA